MPFAGFKQLCEGFCEIAGMPTPALVPDRNGALAFLTRVRDVAVTVMEMSAVRPEVAYLMAECGHMPDDIATDGWRALLHANGHSCGDDCATFSRSPKDGGVILHRAVPWASATAVDLYQHVASLAEQALAWREHCFLEAPPWSESPVPARESQAAGKVQIVEGWQVQLQPPSIAGGCTLLHVSLDAPCATEELPHTLRMLDANFALMTHEWNAAFCRNPHSGALFMRYVLSPTDTHESALRERTGKAVRHAARWADRVARRHSAASRHDLTFLEEFSCKH